MLLNSLFSNDQTTPSCADDLDYYSPPKDALDQEAFDAFFNGGSYPLADDGLKERCESLSINHESIFEDEADIAFSLAGSHEYETKSDAGSFNTCANTINSSKCPRENIEQSQLTKRPPQTTHDRNWTQSLFSGDVSPSNRGMPSSQLEILPRVRNSELSVSKLASLAIRLIDRSSPILPEEWKELDQLEKDTMVSYMENIYCLNLTSKIGVGILDQLNEILIQPPPAKRNEEKLKKTVKKVNSLMTKTFINLNDLLHLSEEEREAAISAAYFGNEMQDSKIRGVFSDNHAFTQKAFSKIVANKRYAEDFEAVMNTYYIPDFIKSRQTLVFKSIAIIRRKLEAKNQKTDTSTSELIKRAPWSLSEILEGVKLCQKIINISALF